MLKKHPSKKNKKQNSEQKEKVNLDLQVSNNKRRKETKTYAM